MKNTMRNLSFALVFLKTLLCLILVVSILQLTACITPVPLIYTYFDPYVSGGKLERSLCGGGAGPKDFLVLDIANNVQLKIKAVRLEKSLPSAIGINLRLVIPKGHVAQLTSRKFELIDKKNNIHYEHEHFGKAWVRFTQTIDSYANVDLLSTFHGDTYYYIFLNSIRTIISEDSTKDYRYVRHSHRLYGVDLAFKGTSTTDFVFRIPSILVDGTEHAIPEIRFTEATKAFIMPLNC